MRSRALGNWHPRHAVGVEARLINELAASDVLELFDEVGPRIAPGQGLPRGAGARRVALPIHRANRTGGAFAGGLVCSSDDGNFAGERSLLDNQVTVKPLVHNADDCLEA